MRGCPRRRVSTGIREGEPPGEPLPRDRTARQGPRPPPRRPLLRHPLRASGSLPGAALACLLAGCGGKRPAAKGPPPRSTIKLATTTSTESSGLLSAILPAFTRRHGIGVHRIPVGTGKALALAENGDVDVVLVHAPGAEMRFVERGAGVRRRGVMRNAFVIVGPPDDPACVRGTSDAPRALARIAAARATFVSRGDRSGTHVKETSLWAAAGTRPGGEWYLEIGQGMGATLVMAHERQAYTLADSGTFLQFRDKVELEVLVAGDARLVNPYSIIAVNPEKHPGVKHAEAMRLVDWMTSAEGQELIGAYRKYGERLFVPVAPR